MARVFQVRAPQRDPVRGKVIVAPTVAYGCLITELSSNEAMVKLDEEQDLPQRVMLFEAQHRSIWECAVRSKNGCMVDLSFIDACSHAARRELLESPALGLLDEPPEPQPADGQAQEAN
jgi:hypothetical protein